MAALKFKPPLRSTFLKRDLPLVLRALMQEPFWVDKTIFLRYSIWRWRLCRWQQGHWPVGCQKARLFLESLLIVNSSRTKWSFVQLHFFFQRFKPLFIWTGRRFSHPLARPWSLQSRRLGPKGTTYLHRTEEIRKVENLFIQPDGPMKGQAAFSRIIMSWIVQAI